MEQRSVKKSTKQDERLILLSYGDNPAEEVIQNRPQSIMSIAPTSLVPVSPLMQPVSADLPNGLMNTPPPDELTITLPSSVELFTEDQDLKMMGKDLKLQSFQQQSALGVYSLGDSFTRLEASIADLNSSVPSVDSLIGEVDPSLFPLKHEDFSPIGKGDLELEQSPFGKDDGINPKLFSENTMDLLHDFDLPGSPADFYVNNDEFPSLDDESLLGVMESDKDSMVTEAVNSNSTPTNINGGMSSPGLTTSIQNPVVKIEKEPLLQLCTPGVIKQENVSGRSFCQVTSDLGSPIRNTPIAICGVSTSSGQSYHFGGPVSSTSQQKESKPVFTVFTQPGTGDEWGRGITGVQRRPSDTFTSTQSFGTSYR